MLGSNLMAIKTDSIVPRVVFVVGGGWAIARQFPHLMGDNAIVVGIDAQSELPKSVVKNNCTVINVALADGRGVPEMLAELANDIRVSVATVAKALVGRLNIVANSGAGQFAKVGWLQYKATTMRATFDQICTRIVQLAGGQPPEMVEILVLGGLAGGTAGGIGQEVPNDFITHLTRKMPTTPFEIQWRVGRLTFSDLDEADLSAPNLVTNCAATTASLMAHLTAAYPDNRVKQGSFFELPTAGGNYDMRSSFAGLMLQGFSKDMWKSFQAKINNSATNNMNFGHIALWRAALRIMQSGIVDPIATAAAALLDPMRNMLTAEYAANETPEAKATVSKVVEHSVGAHQTLVNNATEAKWERVPGKEMDFVRSSRSVTANATLKRADGAFLPLSAHINNDKPKSMQEYAERMKWLTSMREALKSAADEKSTQVVNLEESLKKMEETILGACKVLKPVEWGDTISGLIATSGKSGEGAVELLEETLKNYAEEERDLFSTKAELDALEAAVAETVRAITSLKYYLERVVEELVKLSGSGSSEGVFILDTPESAFADLVTMAALFPEEIASVCAANVVGLTQQGLAALFNCEDNVHAIAAEILKGGDKVTPKWAGRMPGTPLFSWISIPFVEDALYDQIKAIVGASDSKLIFVRQDTLVAGIAAVWYDYHQPRTVEEAMGQYLTDLDTAIATSDERLDKAMLPDHPTMDDFRANVARK